MADYNESTLEHSVLEWLVELGYVVAYGPDISPDRLPASGDA